MSNFKIGDKVSIGNIEGVIIDIDTYTGMLPIYMVKFNDSEQCMPYYAQSLKKIVSSEEVLNNGEILTEDCLYYIRDDCKSLVKIYTIRYENHVYYIRKVKGEIIDFKELI